MINTVLVNADHGCDLHPLADHTIKLRNLTKEENCDFFQHFDVHFSYCLNKH